MATSTSKGFRFHPFDAELIDDFLKPLVVEKRNPCNFIHFRDVYGPGSNPWLIFPKDDPSWFRSPHLKETERCMFVFAKLSKVSTSTAASSKKRGSRKDGCVGVVGNTKKKAGWGTWGGKTIRKQIRDDEDNLIGEHRYLVFELKEIDPEVIGCDWREVGLYKMHEYSLRGINAGLNSDDPIVLCKITFDSSKECKLDLKSGAGDVTNSSSGVDEDLKSGAGDVTNSSSGVDEKAEIIDMSLEGVSGEPTENLTSIAGGVDDPSTATQHCYTATQHLDGNESISMDDLPDIWFSLDDFNVGEDVGTPFDVDPFTPFDVDQFPECLDFNPQNETVEENSMSNLGKRKSEAEDNSSSNKKACVFC